MDIWVTLNHESPPEGLVPLGDHRLGKHLFQVRLKKKFPTLELTRKDEATRPDCPKTLC